MSECVTKGNAPACPQQKLFITFCHATGWPWWRECRRANRPSLFKGPTCCHSSFKIFSSPLPCFTPARRVVWWDTHSCYLENQGYANNLRFSFIPFISCLTMGYTDSQIALKPMTRTSTNSEFILVNNHCHQIPLHSRPGCRNEQRTEVKTSWLQHKSWIETVWPLKLTWQAVIPAKYTFKVENALSFSFFSAKRQECRYKALKTNDIIRPAPILKHSPLAVIET